MEKNDMKTKWMSLFALLGLLALVACGGSADTPAATSEPAPAATSAPAEPTAAPATETAPASDLTLTVWADDTRTPVIEALGAQFTEEYGVTVVVQQVGFGDIRENFTVAAPAGEGPDIIIGAHDWLGELATSGLLEEIDLGDKEGDFSPAAVDAFRYNGVLYGLPYAVENVAFFYNKDIIETPPTTWTEVQELAAELEAEGVVQYGYVLQPGDAFHFMPIQTAFGGYVFGTNDDGYNANDVGLDSPGSIAAAQWLEGMITEGHLSADLDWDAVHGLFESGEAAMMITGPWAVGRFKEAGVNYGIANLPSETQDSSPFLGVQGFMVSAFSKDPLLAQAFLTEFVATEEAMTEIFASGDRPPAHLAVLEALTDPDLLAFGEAGVNGRAMPAIPEMGAVWGAWGDAVTIIFQGQQAADEAFLNAAEQVRTAIGAPEPTPVPEPTQEAVAPVDTGYDINLTIWADDTRTPVIEALGKQFSEEYGVGIIVQQVGFGDIRENFTVAAPAGEGPDIIIGAHDWLGELATSGLLEEIDLGANEAEFSPAAVDAFRYNGVLYGLPYAVENVAFFYNKDLIETPPTTWTEVQELAAELEAEGLVQYGYVLQPGDAFHFMPIQTAFGGYVFGQTDEGYDATDVGLDSEGAIAAAQWLEGMIADGHLSADLDWDAVHALFESGEAAMIITGPWAVGRFKESGVNYGIANLPGETQESSPFLGVQGFMVSAFSSDPLLAQAFLTEFVATEEAMTQIFASGDRPPAHLGVLESLTDPDLLAFGEAGVNGRAMPAIPEMGAVWGAWGDAITIIFQGQQDAQAAFENAAAQVREAIGQ
jgi:arabinogalactan oligomer / maltooligosaccharide transport system substrate-binding protein